MLAQLSTECTHFYCPTCIKGALEEIMASGAFPAYCPICRTESQKQGLKVPPHGRIQACVDDGAAAAALERAECCY